ncbi:CRISPR-associated protein Cas4 [Desulfosarcina ovata subsp. sediminis]|uniref:CRISPR-associated exonuclease Cas4 n=1 Tax=Desulfosarcina ovata subsp. sediminis TaxID=885957 RepID=A0A5K7ZG89_9BACT|nr:CRISPR-associated protein Cas4 [Desulfosarcina ovata]BBO79966.1 CRISPR-associated protein Cas4 [Desulfosarcina ovata subsp. sediminis]
MFAELDLLALSALQHICFCERQCALIHIEQVWLENRFTAEGRIMHERVDTGKSEKRRDVRISSAVALRSLRLGLIGKADVVEFHRQQSPGGKTIWQPFPVEYKRGRPKKDNCDKIQLCAQALCLEEMLDCHIEHGALFYGKTRRRQDVAFDDTLRTETMQMAERLHALFDARKTPPPVFDKRCPNCSFISYCMPEKLDGKKRVSRYLESIREGK